MRRAGSRVFLRHMHDPLTPVGRQIDLLVPRHIFEQTLDIRLFHEAETELDGDDAAAIVVAIEHGHAIAVCPGCREPCGG